MVSRSSRQPSNQPPPDAPEVGADEQGAAGDDEAGRIQSLDQRFGKIEAEQSEQRGMLQQVLDRLPGHAASTGDKGPAGPDESRSPSSSEPGPPDIVSTVRREIADAETRRRQEEADEARRRGDTERIVADQIEKLRGEQQPRDPQTGFRGRLQRLTIGKLD